ncbi:hypothetical protein AHAS_Ahas03G0153900 [Arachis hypogaea]
MMLWSERPLVLRDRLTNEEKIVCLTSHQQGGERVSSSATISCQPQSWRIEESRKGQKPEIHILEEDSLNNSPTRKKLKSVSQDEATVSAPNSIRHVLDKGFRTPDFVDHHFIDEDTRAVLAKMPLENTLPRFQRMLLCSATYVRDAKVEILSLRLNFQSKDKMPMQMLKSRS